MADNDSDSGQPLDVAKIHYLVKLMKRYDLSDLNIRDGPLEIRLRRRGPEMSFTGVPAAPSAPVISPYPAAVSSATPPSRQDPAPEARTVVIRSPMVGTYYASNAPDAPPFVSIGSIVHSETTVCIIEAMKVFTDIPAGVSGKIAEVLIKNGQPVEFDQPLFRVIPA